MQRFEHGGDIYGNPGLRMDFSENTNYLGLPAAGQLAIAEHAGEYSHYPDPQCRSLRKAIGAYHGIDPEQILCGNGAADLILRLCAWKKPRRVLTIAPAFSEYARSAELYGAKVTELAMQESEGFAVPADLPERIPEDAELVFLCSPNNPTGRLVPLVILEAAAKRCAEIGAILLVDECFLPFTAGESALFLLKKYDNLLILRAFTKIYAMAGLRLGYLLGAKELLEQIAPFGAQWSVSSIAQWVGEAVLSHEPDWSRISMESSRIQREAMKSGLEALGAKVYPSDANFMLVRTEKPVYEALRQRGILVRNCSNYTGLDDRFIRIGLKSPEWNAQLLAAMKEVL